jgi:hypothetical protein
MASEATTVRLTTPLSLRFRTISTRSMCSANLCATRWYFAQPLAHAMFVGSTPKRAAFVEEVCKWPNMASAGDGLAAGARQMAAKASLKCGFAG